MRPSAFLLIIAVLVGSALAAADATQGSPPQAPPAASAPAPATSAPAPGSGPGAAHAPATPAAGAGTAAAATAAKASEPSAPSYTYKDYTLSNDLVEVVITDYHGAIRSFSLLATHPIRQHDWQIDRLRHAGLTPLDPASPLSVLDDFNPVGGKHNWITGIGISEAGAAPWTVLESNSTHLVLEHNDPAFLVHYQLSYALLPGSTALTTALSIVNRGTSEVILQPRVIPLNGIHQDDPSSDAAYLAVAFHTGGATGSQTSLNLPSPNGTPQAIDANGASLDYVALKSRFFAALWEPGTLTLSGAAPNTPSLPMVKPAAGESGGPGTVAIPVPAAASGAVPKITANGYKMSDARGGEHQAWISVDYGTATLKPGDSLALDWKLIITSMRHDDLARLTPIEGMVEYTDGYYKFFKVLAKILTYSLDGVAKVVVNYGLALIVLTFLIKLALHRTTFKQQESVMKMQKLAPDLKLLQEQYKSDKQKLYQKQMELWKKHGINPLGGCLPMFIQMPIFIALFQAFCHSADMRGESFLWINDLTLPDQIYGVSLLGSTFTVNPLPLIYIVVTVWMSLTQKLPSGGDPQQEQMAKMMRWMPVVFGAVFYNMPSGLVLYFTINAILTTIEIKMVKRKLGVS
jgi:YidC/Oxa1 family membrane protein insertase